MILLRPDLALLDAAMAGDDALAARLGHAVVPGWVSFVAQFERTRDAAAQDRGDPRWGTCFFVAGEPPELVGWGGFKGPPSDAGTVEIGYEIAPARRERGLATAAARALVADAFSDPRVAAVLAHTLAEPNASNRILEKLGFAFDGETVQRGTTVWRFALRR